MKSPVRTGLILTLLLPLAGCASLVSNAASGLADNLSVAILNQDDPETVRAGAPSYMLLLDSFIEGSPDDPVLLAAGADLYASYGAVFAADPRRASRLTTRARAYAERAMCVRYDSTCGWSEQTYDNFLLALDEVSPRDAELLYTYGLATLAFLRAHGDDWDSLAFLPQVEALFTHYLDITDGDVDPAVHTYMGILLTLRPPALGGKPEEARGHFEKAIQMSGGRDLSAKVEFAKGYAKLLYDRELHDQLLNDVVSADPYADGLTLTNVMAQDEARDLLAAADDYF
ncbi:MAG: TRAP transporter TatT component family protein [Pseudomonadota bacterium]